MKSVNPPTLKANLEPPIYISRQEAGRLAGVGLTTVNKWLKQGSLPCYRVPGTRRVVINRAELLAYIAGCRVEVEA